MGASAQAPAILSGGAGAAVAAQAPGGLWSDVVSRDAEGRITLRATRLVRPLVVDGRLGDEIYQQVPPVGDFTQQEPSEGQPATEKTDIWLFFDDRNVYISSRCWESAPDKRVANEVRRDHRDIQENDNLTVVLDTFYDRRNGVYFQTNALGGLRDMQVSDERNANPDWNAVWDVRTASDDQGWTLEMVIPLKSLRYAASGAQTWGINVRRVVRWKNETSYLSPIPAALGNRGAFKFSSAATLVGIELNQQGGNIELKPFVTAAVLTDRTAVPSPLSNDLQGAIGIDAKYGLTKGLNADFTVNTDFAQVENDETQVNFGRTSVLYPEKRDFFLEGQGIFAFGGVSARAGGGTDGSISNDSGAPNLSPIVFFSRQIGLDGGYEVPIRAGTRVTGRAGKYSLGLLNIQTGGSARTNAVSTNFSVVRVRRDVLKRGAVGVIGTFRPQRIGDAQGSNEVYGVDTTLAFFQNLNIASYFAQSSTPGTTGDSTSYLVKVDNVLDRWGFNAERLKVGESFSPEIGFLRRTGFTRTFGQAQFTPRPRGSTLFRKFSYRANADVLTNPHGDLESREVTGTFRMDFASGEQVEVEAARNDELLEERFSIARGAGDRVSVEPGEYRFGEFRSTFYVAPQRPVTGRFTFIQGTFYDGTRTEAGFSGRLNLSARVGLEPRIQYDWIDLPAGRFTTKLVGARIGFAVSPRMAFSSLIQFSSAASSLTSNVRFRWEYTPGSDLFVVYTDGRDSRLSGFPTLQSRSFVVKATRMLRW